MNSVYVFVAEMSLSLALSVFVLARLQTLLRRVGNEVCERGGFATEFWLAYLQLMLVIAPALLVAWFSRAGQHYVEVEQLKSSVFVVLIGQFVGLALVGRAVWKSIVRPEPEKPAAPVTTPKLVEAA
jgi:hypothetical protein